MNFTEKIDILNIFLILFSLVLAVVLPFKLFLFSYAVLGPLHYLTEINWLNDKSYFVERRNKFLIPVILIALGISIINIISFYNVEVILFGDIFKSDWYQLTLPWTNHLIFVCFAFAILIFVKPNKTWLFYIVWLLVFAFIALFLDRLETYKIWFGTFFPTIVHVYLFTGLFMLYGALKSKSKWGIVSFLTMLSVIFILAFIDVSLFDFQISGSNSYMKTSFKIVNFLHR